METVIQVKERPVLFKGAMVAAVLNETKTETRRLVKCLEPDEEFGYFMPKPPRLRERNDTGCAYCKNPATSTLLLELCPYGKPGERLWVRETFHAYGSWEKRFNEKKQNQEWHFVDQTLLFDYAYAHDVPQTNHKPKRADGLGWWKRPSIHMPRVASRILLEITSVRVERLQDISYEDALAEGVWRPTAGLVGMPGYSAINAYKELWNSINGPAAWDLNPWVWRVAFRRVAP